MYKKILKRNNSFFYGDIGWGVFLKGLVFLNGSDLKGFLVWKGFGCSFWELLLNNKVLFLKGLF